MRLFRVFCLVFLLVSVAFVRLFLSHPYDDDDDDDYNNNSNTNNNQVADRGEAAAQDRLSNRNDLGPDRDHDDSDGAGSNSDSSNRLHRAHKAHSARKRGDADAAFGQVSDDDVVSCATWNDVMKRSYYFLNVAVPPRLWYSPRISYLRLHFEALMRTHFARVAQFQRYSVDSMVQRIIPGPLRLHAIYNEGRGTKKRIASEDAPMHVVREFNPEAWNFNRADNKELLFTLEPKAAERQQSSSNQKNSNNNRENSNSVVLVSKYQKKPRRIGGNEEDDKESLSRFLKNSEGQNTKSRVSHDAVGQCLPFDQADPRDKRLAVFVNVSPIDADHVLFVPTPRRNLPQRITAESLEDMLWLHQFVMDAPNFVIAFNGYAGWATVNHLHYQAYLLNMTYSEDGLYPIQRIERITERVGPGFAKEFPLVQVQTVGSMWPVRTLIFAGEPAQVARAVESCVHVLERKNIAYNAVLERPGLRDIQAEPEYPSVFLFPRAVGKHYADDFDFHPGFPELSGHIILKNKDFYESATEADITMRLARESLSKSDFEEILSRCTSHR